MTDRIHAPMHPVEPPSRDALRHGAGRKPERRELRRGHKPVLPGGEAGQTGIEGGGWVILPVLAGELWLPTPRTLAIEALHVSP